MILAILVEGFPRNIPVKFKIHPLVKQKLFKGFFLFLVLSAILFTGAEWFEQFGRGSP